MEHSNTKKKEYMDTHFHHLSLALTYSLPTQSELTYKCLKGLSDVLQV